MYIYPNSKNININLHQLNYRSFNLVNNDSVLPTKKTQPYIAKSPSSSTITAPVNFGQKIKQIIPKSTISVGYDYGFFTIYSKHARSLFCS